MELRKINFIVIAQIIATWGGEGVEIKITNSVITHRGKRSRNIRKNIVKNMKTNVMENDKKVAQ
jgi:hypothetical protein